MKSLRELFYAHEGKLIHKWDHYFDIYEKYFSKYVGKEISLLEIGISHGGSIQLWKKYFGEQVKIYAIDINPECARLTENNTTIFIGSQSDPVFLKKVTEQIPMLDIIIDDGGHTMQQQKVSFEYLFSRVKDGGIYLVEDTHTSYWRAFHGGYKKRNSFIEYAKNLIDSLYADHMEKRTGVRVNEITKSINSISFYDSIVVFEKIPRPKPFHIQKGEETIIPYVDPTLKKESLPMKIRNKIFGSKVHSFWKNSKGKM